MVTPTWRRARLNKRRWKKSKKSLLGRRRKMKLRKKRRRNQGSQVRRREKTKTRKVGLRAERKWKENEETWTTEITN